MKVLTKKLRTRMNVARAENYWPPYKNNDQVSYLSKYIEDFKQDSTSAIENLESHIMHSKVQSKILLYDTLLILFKQKMPFHYLFLDSIILKIFCQLLVLAQ